MTMQLAETFNEAAARYGSGELSRDQRYCYCIPSHGAGPTSFFNLVLKERYNRFAGFFQVNPAILTARQDGPIAVKERMLTALAFAAC